MNKRFNFSAVGISSLLVIFAVLCLTVFAILTTSTVEAQLRLAKASRNAVTEYYAADCKAQKILSQIRGGKHPPNVDKNGDIYSYVCPISQTVELRVQVKVKGQQFTVLQWQTVSTAKWDTDNRLPVWDGQKS